MKARATMQDVADALGVAKATVSRAFRNHPKCGPQLRERILAKAKELGYAPDPLQRAHMAQVRTGRPEGMRGAVIWMLDYVEHAQRIEVCRSNSRLMNGARTRAESMGLKLEVFRPEDHGLNGAGLKRVMQARGIVGAIVAPMPRPHARLDYDFTGVSAVAIAHSLEWPALHRVGHDHYQATWEAMAYLRARGKRRVGLAMPRWLSERVGWRWHASYAEYCQDHPEMVRAPALDLVERASDSWRENREWGAVCAWAKAHRLDAVLSLNPWLMAALEHDPATRDVLYFELDWFAEKSPLPCPGIDQKFEMLGAAAVEEVVAQWGRQEYGVPSAPKTILLSGRIVETSRTGVRSVVVQ